MSVEIAWLLSQRHLRLTRKGSFTGRPEPITFVHATELRDPGPWLSGGEFVLTTGLALPAEPVELRSYVDGLHAAGVSCLGFGVGLSHSEVPDAIVQRADDLGLVVLEVPFEVPFAAVVRTVMNRIAEQEYEEVIRAAQIQSRITRATLRGGVDAIVKELALATGTTVAHLGRRTHALHPPSEVDFLDEVRRIMAEPRRAGTNVSISVSEPGRTVTVHSVGLSPDSAGVLAMRSTGPISSVNRVLLGHAVSLVTLDMEQPARLRREQSSLHSLAVAMLLDSRFDHTAPPAALNDATGADGHIRVVAVRSSQPSTIVDRIDGYLEQAGRGLFCHIEDEVVLFLLRADDASEWVVDALPDGVDLTAGVSAPHPLRDAAQAAAQARMALGAAGSQRLVVFDSDADSVLLRSAPARDAFLTLASSTVVVLATHDREHGGELSRSLRVYLESHGHWEGAAARLGIHRHTLRGRIARVQEILDIDLSNARVRAELLLAILVSDGSAGTETS